MERIERLKSSRTNARTIRLVWFTGEELDRRGSRAYVAAHAYDQDVICLYVNVDSGFTIEHGEPQIAVTGRSGVVKMIEDLTVRIGWRVRVHESSSVSNDTVPFQERGIPTVFVYARLETPGPHPHLPTDRFDKLDADKIKLIGGLSLAIIDATQQNVLRDVMPQ
jgi:Zn-dependent M28 family amino/carboxypeptidase